MKAIAAGSAGAVYDPLPESKAKHDVVRAIFAGAIDIGSRLAISSHGSVNMVAGADEGGTGSQIVIITAAMRVLGRDGRVMDRLAVRSGDILLRHGDTVLDELASTATICGPLAQAEGAQRPMILNVATLLPNGADLGTSKLHRRSDVVVVLLLPSTRLKLPPGQAFAGLKPGLSVQVTGTLNWRTHALLRPTSLVVGASPRAQQCITLSVYGDQDCAGEPQGNRSARGVNSIPCSSACSSRPAAGSGCRFRPRYSWCQRAISGSDW